MKKLFLVLTVGLLIHTVDAQILNTDKKGVRKQSELDWYNCSFELDGVYGAEINRAYSFLKDKKIKKRPVVALIGTGMDVEHEDLKDAIWKNKKEKADGKDNDKNGLIDDVNGWNFLGGKDGKVMENTMREGDREFFRLKDKNYSDYMSDGKQFYKIIDGKKIIVDAPADMEEYNYFWKQVLPESPLAGAYCGLQLSRMIVAYANQFDKMMKERFPGKELTQKEFGICYDLKAPRDSLCEVAFMYCITAFGVMETDSWEKVYSSIRDGKLISMSEASYEAKLKQYGSDGRADIVGDNYLDITDDKYGNNVLLTADAALGTMCAGIIAGGRSNGLGGDGIMDQAKVMNLRVFANGEPYLKDIALAIRYAVDHGADIIMLPMQNTLYPEVQKQWICSALRYAEQKGALVVVQVGERAQNLNEISYFPNRWMDGDKELTNLMTVGVSDKAGNPLMESNYGKKELDLFAPGRDIYSTYMGDTYQIGNGYGFAAATTVGVAALLKAYYPSLTGAQIRNILLETVTLRKDAEVEKVIVVNGQRTQDLYLMEDLCLSGGILNAYQAVLIAEKMMK